MTRHQKTALLCILAGVTATGIGFKAFVWGFNYGAVKYAPIVQTQAVGAENSAQWQLSNSLQAYNDSVYYLEPTVIPTAEQNKLVSDNAPLTIQQLIQQSYDNATTSKLPEWGAK